MGKRVPFSDSTWMVPPWASIRLLVMLSPSPVPPNFLVALMSPCKAWTTTIRLLSCILGGEVGGWGEQGWVGGDVAVAVQGKARSPR